MNISIGTPPVQVIGIVETGGKLTWAQCKPCKNCYNQKLPIFEPEKSSTFKTLTCNSKFCKALDLQQCDKERNICGYNYSINSIFTSESIATESLAIGSTSGRSVTFPKIVFGCGHYNKREPYDGYATVGLGSGPLSLISQLSPSIKGKFSYCFVPTSAQANATSKITFGDTSFVAGPGVVSTRLFQYKHSHCYWVNLNAISVGNSSLHYFTQESTFDSESNTIIDTGCRHTYVDSEFYEVLATTLEEKVGSKRVSDPRGYGRVCFKVEKESDLPILTFHLDGADLKLPTLNSFVIEEDLMCLNIIPSDPIVILGNFSQMGFLVAYDLVKKIVSFKPTDCTKH